MFKITLIILFFFVATTSAKDLSYQIIKSKFGKDFKTIVLNIERRLCNKFSRFRTDLWKKTPFCDFER